MSSRSSSVVGRSGQLSIWTGPAFALMKPSSSVASVKWRRISVLASGEAKVFRPQWINSCSAPFRFGQRGDSARRIFTTMKNAKINGRAIGNSQRRDTDRLPISSASLAPSSIGRLWSR